MGIASTFLQNDNTSITTQHRRRIKNKKKLYERIPQNIKKFVLNVAGTAHTAVQFYTTHHPTTHHSVFIQSATSSVHIRN